ncbi:MAG: hypothetical protein GY941_14225 [Planctomycetes bacterium]|nr:hypothetical protein [Planctomycetota bacterium]
MTNTENFLARQDNEETTVPLKSFYGMQYSLHTLNLALLCIVILLSILSVTLYLFSAKMEVPDSPVKTNAPESSLHTENSMLVEMISKSDKKSNKDFDIVSSRNIFSAQRKEWVAKPKVPKIPHQKNKIKSIIKKPPKPPKKIVLYGIIMAGKVKKAMISNPKAGVRKKKTLHVKEGENIEGYKVKSIETDKVILDWQGEEIILKLYSGPKSGPDPSKGNQRRVSPRRRDRGPE